jgi:hypothetical protein
MGGGHHVVEVKRVHVVSVFKDLPELFREQVEFRLAQREAGEFGNVRDVLTTKR